LGTTTPSSFTKEPDKDDHLHHGNRRCSSSIIMLDSNCSQTHQKFRGMQKLTKAALVHIATHLTHAEVEELRDIFQQMDTNGVGTLTLQDLDAALVALAHQQQQY